MIKHVTDSERLITAALNRKETQLKEAYEKIDRQEAEIRALTTYITELRNSNKILCNQISNLFSYHRNHV